jgi:4-amino-4-deoxy-L-arabinose transferase-like glycosyltransferase
VAKTTPRTAAAPRSVEWPPDLLTDRATSKAGALLYVVAIVAIAFWDLGGRAIWHRDLPRFAVIAREMMRSGDWLLPTQYGEPYVNKPILYVWLVAIASLPFDAPTALTLRLPSALALVATALATAAWGTARTGSVVRGRLAGLLVATTFLIHELGRVGRPDMLATACSTIAAMLVDRGILGKHRHRDSVWLGFALGAGLLAKGPVVLLLPLAVALVPRRAVPFRERMKGSGLLHAVPIALGVAALWLVPAWLRGGDRFLEGLVVRQTAERLAGEGNHLEAWWYYPPELASAFVPWIALYATLPFAFASRSVRARLGDAAHVVATLAVLVALSAVPTKHVRYAAILAPPLAVASVQVLADLAERARRPRLPALALRLLALVALAGAVAIVVEVVRWPEDRESLLVPLAPVAVLLAGAAVGAWIAASREAGTPPRLHGRIAGLGAVLAACALLVYWGALGRYLVHAEVLENRAVAAARREGVPAVLFSDPRAGGVEPDDLYEAAADAPLVRDAKDLPSPERAPRLDVIALERDADAAARARGETPRVRLDVVRRDGKRLQVLGFGAP